MKLGVIKSLKPMLNLLLPNDDLREEAYDYVPLLLAEYQGSLEALFITQVRVCGHRLGRRLGPGVSGGAIWVEGGIFDILTSDSRPHICALRGAVGPGTVRVFWK